MKIVPNFISVPIGRFSARHHLSAYMCFLVLVLTCSQMMPGLHMLVMLPFMGAAVALTAYFAYLEGKAKGSEGG